ncbi:MAG: hypothetical protein D6785_01330 [Planctomycetota bacterium]|nr:MAG: hypothetical protein D6785_01330 [Planctomycetota bacterium]
MSNGKEEANWYAFIMEGKCQVFLTPRVHNLWEKVEEKTLLFWEDSLMDQKLETSRLSFHFEKEFMIKIYNLENLPQGKFFSRNSDMFTG